ncbi:MAG TPA: ATP-binding protein [candidate division Zixibacteria bacterium]|jgi:signal transduction histidine kinase
MLTQPNNEDTIREPWLLRSKRRLFVTLLLAIAIPPVVLGAVGVARISNQMQDLTVYRNELAAHLFAHGMETECFGLMRYVQSYANRSLLAKAVMHRGEARAHAVLEELVTQHLRISRAFIADTAGVLQYDYPQDSTVRGVSFAHRDWFLGVRGSGQPYISEVYRRAALGQPLVLGIACPIRDAAGLRVGYLMAQVSLSDIIKEFSGTPTPGSLYYAVIDHRDHWFDSRSVDGGLTDLRGMPFLDTIRQLAGRTMQAQNPVSGRREVISARVIPSFGWTVLTCQLESDAFVSAMGFAAGGAAFLFAMLLAMSFLSYSSFRALRRHDAARHLVLDQLQSARADLERQVRLRTRELSAKTEALERSNVELQQFASVASHDLQEPLRKIQAFGDRLAALCAGGLPDGATDYLTRMQNAAARMRSLIDELLAYSRVTSHGRHFEPTDLSRVASEVLSDLEARLEQTGGEVVVDHLPTIDADPRQMRQLFQNLIGNALKFHRPDTVPRVCVSGRMIGGAASSGNPPSMSPSLCRITVADDGIGFDTKYLDKVFAPFQRLHGRSQYEGSGMGLAICRRIAEHHGGSITAESTPGAGAQFIVTLPVTHENEGSMPWEHAESRSPSSWPTMMPMTVN